jgi:hypothetical protein
MVLLALICFLGLITGDLGLWAWLDSGPSPRTAEFRDRAVAEWRKDR